MKINMVSTSLRKSLCIQFLLAKMTIPDVPKIPDNKISEAHYILELNHEELGERPVKHEG